MEFVGSFLGCLGEPLCHIDGAAPWLVGGWMGAGVVSEGSCWETGTPSLPNHCAALPFFLHTQLCLRRGRHGGSALGMPSVGLWWWLTVLLVGDFRGHCCGLLEAFGGGGGVCVCI